jgi:hypothetical protein
MPLPVVRFAHEPATYDNLYCRVYFSSSGIEKATHCRSNRTVSARTPARDAAVKKYLDKIAANVIKY